MKTKLVFLVLIALALNLKAQEYIQQPTTINTWQFVSEWGAEFPYNKNIYLQYDSQGNLSHYHHVINYPNSPYYFIIDNSHDALNRLLFKQTYRQEGSDFGYRRYYYTYDEYSNITECLVKKLDKSDIYFSEEFINYSEDVYRYESGKKSRWNHFVYSNDTFLLQYYWLYEYSANEDWSAETKYNVNDQPQNRAEYTFSDDRNVLTKTSFSWSSETGEWVATSLTEFEYDEGVLREKRITTWSNNEIQQRQRQVYTYDDKGNCTLVLFQTMVDGVYADKNRANYLYDADGLCTNANAERWNDTAWVLGGFPSGTYLFFDDVYKPVNEAMGAIANCTRAEVTSYSTTPNPQYILNPVNLEGEWYYEIFNTDGSVTYQHLQCAGDTTVGGERPKIIVRTNTIYDKDDHQEVTHEYVYERNDTVYWWNRELGEFTLLYDLSAVEGDEWTIRVGDQSLVMHVDSVKYTMMNKLYYRTLCVSDPDCLFSGEIVCGLGHMTSFFPEKLMSRGDYEVKGLRCYWVGDTLVYHNGVEDCDAIHQILVADETSVTAGFQIFPNPADDALIIITDQCTSPLDCRITNILGHVIASPSTLTLDISSFPPGLYFITLGNQTRRFIKR